jgi:hypothetical protein
MWALTTTSHSVAVPVSSLCRRHAWGSLFSIYKGVIVAWKGQPCQASSESNDSETCRAPQSRWSPSAWLVLTRFSFPPGLVTQPVLPQILTAPTQPHPAGAYSGLSASNPGCRSIHLGTGDHSLQRLAYQCFGQMYCIIRLEGTLSTSGSLGSYSYAYEATFSRSMGTFEYRKCGSSYNGLSGVSNGASWVISGLPLDQSFTLFDIGSASTITLYPSSYISETAYFAPTTVPTFQPSGTSSCSALLPRDVWHFLLSW